MLLLQTKKQLIKKNYCRAIFMAALMPFSTIILANASVENDARLSDMGPDGDSLYDARDPAVAYNSKNNEYLVVWAGDDDTGSLVNGEQEIFGQLIDAATGAEIGIDFRLSDMGTDGLTNYFASTPSVTYNATNNEYFVVWSGSDNNDGMVADEYEIFGQRVDASTGMEVGGDIRLSNMGPIGDQFYDALTPALAYNNSNNEYFVVWSGSNNIGTLVAGEYEIYGQRINAATGVELGVATRLSNMGTDGSFFFDAITPDVTYNATQNEYLVVWSGDDGSGAMVNDENEIYGQRVNAATGDKLGAEIRISFMGDDGDASFDAFNPAVAYDEIDNEYMVVWSGDDYIYRYINPLSSQEITVFDEIWGQLIDADTGDLISFKRISKMGSSGVDNYGAYNPAVSYNVSNDRYLVVWSAADYKGALVDDEYEIYGAQTSGKRNPGPIIGIPDPDSVPFNFRLSDMGPDGNIFFSARNPVVAYNANNNESFVVWHGEDDIIPLVSGESEIFGERIVEPTIVRFTSNNLSVGEAAGSVAVEVTLIGNVEANEIFEVFFYSEDSSAMAPVDYTNADTVLIFQPGERSKTIDIPIHDNSDSEGNRAIQLRLSTAFSFSYNGYAPVDKKLGTALLTIIDDESAIDDIDTDNNVVDDADDQDANSSGGSAGGALAPVNLLVLILLCLWRNRSST